MSDRSLTPTDPETRNAAGDGKPGGMPGTSPERGSMPPAGFDWDGLLRTARKLWPLAGLAAALLTGLIGSLGSAILVLAATALLIAISTLWSSLQIVAGDAPAASEQVTILTAPGAELEQKQALLRALKDLEFERSVGKITDEDYLELRDRYRTRAKAVLQSLDRELEPALARAEKLADEYLLSKGLGPRSAPDRMGGADPKPEASSSVHAGVKCPSCSTANDSDAVFCKKCGERIGSAASPNADGAS